MTKITLRYFDGCPHWQLARTRLEEAMGKASFETRVKLETIQTPKADRVLSCGSPTILIDGIDPFGDLCSSNGPSCRVYQTENGIEGSPSVSQLVRALEE